MLCDFLLYSRTEQRIGPMPLGGTHSSESPFPWHIVRLRRQRSCGIVSVSAQHGFPVEGTEALHLRCTICCDPPAGQQKESSVGLARRLVVIVGALSMDVIMQLILKHTMNGTDKAQTSAL